MRKPPKPSKTGILLLSLSSVFLLLLILYLAVLSPLMAQGEETTTTTVSTLPGEGEGILEGSMAIFPRVERLQMQSIRVFNQYDAAKGGYQSYAFLRDTEDQNGDGDTADFIIENFPGHTYQDEKFARLVVDAGYTAYLGRLTLDFSANDANTLYARYGLAPEQHPAYYILQTMDGTSYTVYIGAKSPDGNYYARLEGREAVYILQSTMQESILAPLTYFVEAHLTFTGDTEYGYAYIQNFAVFHDSQLKDSIFGTGGKPSLDASTFSPFVMFTYLNTDERDVYHTANIYGIVAPDTPYTANDVRIDAALQKLPGLTGIEVLKLGLSDSDFAPGGLLENAAYTIYYEMPYGIRYDDHDDPLPSHYVKSVLFITPLDGASGTYTVGSLSYREDGEVFYHMIARVEASALSFLEYSFFDWMSEQMFSTAIDHVASMEISSARGDYFFEISGDGTADQVVRELYSGFSWTYLGRNHPFAVNDRGYCDDISEFRELYLMLLRLSYSGELEADGWTQEACAAVMQDDSNCILTLALTLEDGRQVTYRFFPYSERHAMVSVTGDGMQPITTFYTSSVMVRRLAEASYQLMHGIQLNADHRY